MTLDHIIIAAVVGAVLFCVARSLVRTWRGKSEGGCAGCPGCGNLELDATADKSNRQIDQSKGEEAG